MTNQLTLQQQLRQSHFLLSVAKLSQLPPDAGAEIAFVGASNVGKSSALNYLCDQKRLAYTSKTPGRTQLINFFEITENERLVDLPGYGFAQVPIAVKQSWQQLIEGYLQHRQSLKGLILLVDCRHVFKPLDQQLIELSEHLQRPVHILLTKADKLRYGASQQCLLKTKQQLPEDMTVQLFSVHTKIGRDQLIEQLSHWLGR